jgi:serine/threonine protein kinase
MAFIKKLFKTDKEKKEEEERKKADEAAAAQQKAQSASAASKPATTKLTRDDFEDVDVLGKGTFAVVVLARKKGTEDYFALKVIDKKKVLDHKRQRDAFIERDVMARLPHPYVLRLHATFQSEHKLFFVVDYMPGGDFDKYLGVIPNKALDLETAQLYAAEIFLAVKHLHDNGVIYRDLKPENILMSREGHVVLADFGLSKDFGQDADQMVAASFVGSPFYVAPDVLKQRPYNEAVDFWSFGVLMYRMIYGRTPFTGRTMKEVFDSIMLKDVTFPTSYVVPNDGNARDLILKLLQKDPAKRINGEEVMRHPFWTGLDFQKVMRKEVLPKHWKALPSAAEHVRNLQAQAGAAPAVDPTASGAKPKQNPTDVTHTLPKDNVPLTEKQQGEFHKFTAQ